MLLRAKIAIGFTAGAMATVGGIAATRLVPSTQTVVAGTAYATVENTADSPLPFFTESEWFEPSAALIPRGTCDNKDDDRLVVRHNSLHYRDGAAADGPVEVLLPRPPLTERLGTDSQLGRLKDGRLLYVEFGQTTRPYKPAPGWESSNGWNRTTFELFTSRCGKDWMHALTIDTKDFEKGQCAWPQVNPLPTGDIIWPGGFDRFELHVDPYTGDVFISTLCRGGTWKDFLDHLYHRTLLFRIRGATLDDPAGIGAAPPAPGKPGVKPKGAASPAKIRDWTLTKGIQLSYHAPVAVTSTSDGSVFLARCDRQRRLQLLRLDKGGERLVSVTNVHHSTESQTDASCALFGDVTVESAGMRTGTTELRLGPAGPRSVRLAYQQVRDGRPQLRYYHLDFPPLPAGHPCAEVRKTYLAGFEVPTDADEPQLENCGEQPTPSKARTVDGTDQASIVHFDLIAPDSSALASPGAMASGLMYWMEHSPDTGMREEKYLTIGPDGGWSAIRTASSEPWQAKIRQWKDKDGNTVWSRDGDYEYGGFAFVDGRCRYALVWNESHAVPAGPNLYPHWAIVDDLSCTGQLVSPAPVAKSHTAKPTPSAAPSSSGPTPSVGVTTQPPVAPSTSAPASPTPSPSPSPSQKFTVKSIDLEMDPCVRQADGTYRCNYRATFTLNPGRYGTFMWRVLGTLRHDCYPVEGSGEKPFKSLNTVAEIDSGQTTYTRNGWFVFDEPPNPTEVYGQPGQASTAYVQIDGGMRSTDEEFYSSAVCGKP